MFCCAATRPELAAFVDWEMCTIGDPLLDLGWMLICWPLDTNTDHRRGALAALGGLASRRELLDAYWAAGGRETSRLDWYVAMACFKLGIVIEGTWSRYLMGRPAARRARHCTRRPESDRHGHPGRQGRQPVSSWANFRAY